MTYLVSIINPNTISTHFLKTAHKIESCMPVAVCVGFSDEDVSKLRITYPKIVFRSLPTLPKAHSYGEIGYGYYLTAFKEAGPKDMFIVVPPDCAIQTALPLDELRYYEMDLFPDAVISNRDYVEGIYLDRITKRLKLQDWKSEFVLRTTQYRKLNYIVGRKYTLQKIRRFYEKEAALLYSKCSHIDRYKLLMNYSIKKTGCKVYNTNDRIVQPIEDYTKVGLNSYIKKQGGIVKMNNRPFVFAFPDLIQEEVVEIKPITPTIATN